MSDSSIRKAEVKFVGNTEKNLMAKRPPQGFPTFVME